MTSPIYDDYINKTERRLKVIENLGEKYFFTVATGEKVPEEALNEAMDYFRKQGAF